jgi:hypothetical protein
LFYAHYRPALLLLEQLDSQLCLEDLLAEDLFLEELQFLESRALFSPFLRDPSFLSSRLRP